MQQRIAMLAPPWIPIPPPEYGGVEQVVDLVSTELERRGHGFMRERGGGGPHAAATAAHAEAAAEARGGDAPLVTKIGAWPCLLEHSLYRFAAGAHFVLLQ